MHDRTENRCSLYKMTLRLLFDVTRCNALRQRRERVVIGREIQIPAEFMLGTWDEVSFDFVTQ